MTQLDSPLVCSGCGSNWSDERLAEEKRRDPRILSCCPERKMVAGVFCERSDDLCFAPECMARGCMSAGADGEEIRADGESNG